MLLYKVSLAFDLTGEKICYPLTVWLTVLQLRFSLEYNLTIICITMFCNFKLRLTLKNHRIMKIWWCILIKPLYYVTRTVGSGRKNKTVGKFMSENDNEIWSEIMWQSVCKADFLPREDIPRVYIQTLSQLVHSRQGLFASFILLDGVSP